MENHGFEGGADESYRNFKKKNDSNIAPASGQRNSPKIDDEGELQRLESYDTR